MRGGQMFSKLVAAVASLLVMFGGLFGPADGDLRHPHSAAAAQQSGAVISALSGRGVSEGLDAWDAAWLVDRVSPALVDVNAEHTDGTVSSGSGIVLTSEGLVLTNHHVIQDAETLRVTSLGNDRVYPAQVVGADRQRDLAVLALRGASGLPIPVFGDSDRVEIGDQVASIGNAYGDGGQPSVNTGPITGLKHSIGSTTGTGVPLRGLIKARNHIAPGESGGAMVNAQGEVIGVNVAYAAECDGCGPNGAGYAIPINQALRIAHRFAEGA